MTTSPILSGQSFSEEKTRQIVEAFYHDGFVHIPGVLDPDEIKALRDRTDELLDDPVLAERENLDLQNKKYVQVMPHSESGEKLPFILRNTIELDPIFRICSYASQSLVWQKRSWGQTAGFAARMCCEIVQV